MAVLVTYNLTGAGGAECFVELGDQTAHVTASYLSDALGDLLRAVVTVLSGGLESTASFAEEPGEYRWRFLRTSDDVLAVRILWFKESRTDWPDERGEVVMDSQCRLRTFAGAVLSASQRVLQEHGVDGYRTEVGPARVPAGTPIPPESGSRRESGEDLRSWNGAQVGETAGTRWLAAGLKPSG